MLLEGLKESYLSAFLTKVNQESIKRGLNLVLNNDQELILN